MFKERYFSDFEIKRKEFKEDRDMYLIGFNNFNSDIDEQAYPKKAVLKIINLGTKEDEIHRIASELNSQVPKLYYTRTNTKTKEMYIEYLKRGSLEEEFLSRRSTFTKKSGNRDPFFAESFIVKGILDLSTCIRDLHNVKIFHGNISLKTVYLANNLILSGFSHSGFGTTDLNLYDQKLNPPQNDYGQMIRNPFDSDLWNLGYIFFQLLVGPNNFDIFNQSAHQISILINTELDKIKIENKIKHVIRELLKIYPEEYIDSRDKLSTIFQNITIPEIIAESPRKGQLCEYCGNARNNDVIKNIGCNHYYHASCLSLHYRDIVANASRIEELTCKRCNHRIDYDIESKFDFVDFEYNTRLKASKLFLASNPAICQQCGLRTDGCNQLNEKLERYKVRCPEESIDYCSLCSLSYHVFDMKCNVLSKLKKEIKSLCERRKNRKKYNRMI